MLYLEPPFHTINGVCVLRDHADPLQWYAMPVAPRLSTVDELVGADTRRVPQLSLIKFRGSAGNGGFVNFDVDLALPDDLREVVAMEIKRLEQLPERPRLANLPVVDGTVKIMLFDKETPPPAPDGNGTAPPPPAGDDGLEFVLKLSHSAKPSLYGDQRAAFSVELTQEGVTTFEKAVQGELSPIGIVYSLDYLGLRPAYNVKVHVDWERVQTHLEEHEELNIPLIYSSSIDKVVDELVDERIIEITADTFVTEDDGSEVIARRDEAMQEVRDMITETFFEPSLDPVDRGDDVDDGVRTAGRIMRAVASGGMSELTAFSRREVDLTRIDRKRLDVSMSERTTVRRTIFPQGHLSGLFRTLALPGMSLDRFVTDVDLDDPWFHRREIELISRADFAGDEIRSLDVELDYEGTTLSALLTPEADRDTISWSSVLRNGGMVRDVSCRFTVNFADVDGTERPRTLASGPISTIADKLEIDPRQLYAALPVPIVALNFPWQRYPQVEVELAYDDEPNEIAQSDVVVLTPERPETTWHMFVRDPARKAFRYQVTCRAADQRDQVLTWTTAEAERVTVRDPFPAVRRLDVTPVLDWTAVERVFVDLSYFDDDNNIAVEESFEFSETKPDTQTLRINLGDPQRRAVGYRVTVMNKNGSLVEVPPSTTLQNRITVRADMRGHRVVSVRPDGRDFAALAIREVTVNLRYRDDGHGLDIADAVTLLGPEDAGTFEFDYVVEGRTAYAFQVVTTFTNNLTRTRDWTSVETPDLVIRTG